MTGAISIEKRVAGTSGCYVGRIDGVDGEAELRFTIRGPSLISADHTDPGTGWLTLDHDAIKGFMCAMEMMFQVKSPDLSKNLHPGDVVDFKIDAAKYVLVEVTVVGHAK